MINVIGLGTAGCKIVEGFSQYPQYKVYKVNTGLKKEDCSFTIPKRETIEEHESKFPARVLTQLRKIQGDVLFVVAGGSRVSSASLRILEALKKNKTEVLYIKQDEEDSNKESRMLDRVTFNVFQQYARSGLFERLYLVSNSEIQKTVGNIPIGRYFEVLNGIITSAFHMLKVCENSNPAISTLPPEDELSRICTIGIGEIEKNTDQMFFSLDNTLEKRYYFSINEKQIEQDVDLLSKIKIRTRQKDDSVRAGYGVYPSEYEKNYIYILSQTKITQGEEHG
jgi:hypothetical protein